MSNFRNLDLTFTTLIEKYKKLQSGLVQQVRALASKMSATNAGSFILLQFEMAQVTQVGESISNLISQVNKVVGNAISNQKTN